MKRKVLLLGWDAADWEIIQPLLNEGKMPALASLIKRGVHGNMSTLNPPYSPMLWTSAATGKTPDKHGILGFIELDTEKQQVRPVTVAQRKVKALWNILHNQGLKSNLVGWWPSHPAEPINGNIVTDQFFKGKRENATDFTVPEGSVYPEDLAEKIADLNMHPSELTAAHILPFIPKANEIDQEKENSLVILSKILAENTSVHACATWLMQNTEWDFMGVYYNLIDHICHGFMRFHPPKLQILPEKIFERYRHVVEGAYRFQDMMLERMLKLAGEETMVMVMSDHGFVSDESRMIKPPDIHAGPALEHREFGMFVAAGPGVKQGEKIFGTSLLDITPTVLNYLGIPSGSDMDGTVMKDLFVDDVKEKKIDSWENVKGSFGLHEGEIVSDPFSSQAAMEQLIELGYVDRPNEKMENAIQETSRDLRFNLARVFLGQRKFEEGEALIHELLNEPGKKSTYLLEMIQLKMTLNQKDEARKYLKQLREEDPSAAHRTRLIEGKLLMMEGEHGAAQRQLEELTQRSVIAGYAYFELGKLHVHKEEYPAAIACFEKAIESKPNNARFHFALAKAYLLIEEAEKALDSALQSIHLVRYFPDAHYVLGQALEQLGETEQAKLAFETAEKLNPKMNRATLAKENLEAELINEIEPQNAPQGEEVIIVSGLPRSGTSAMMQMLQAGGVEVLTDGKREEDQDNPKGYLEYEKVKALHQSNDWMHEAEGKALKVISQLLKHLPPTHRYKVVFMIRDLEEVLESQRIMLKNHGIRPKEGVREAFVNELKKIDSWVRREPGVELIRVSYSDMIHKPEETAFSVAEFLGTELNQKAMAEAIDPNLYRNRIFRIEP